MVVDGRAPNYFPMQRATDQEIGVLASVLDAFPLRVKSAFVCYGASKLGDMVAWIHQARSYRKVFFKRDSRWETTILFEMGGHIGSLEGGGAFIISGDVSTISEADLEEVMRYTPGTDDLRPEDAEYFAKKYPYFSVYSGMAVTDVLIAEFELGKPVFYGLIPRPEQGVVMDVTTCLRDGEVVSEKDEEYWLRYLLEVNFDG